MKKDIYITVFTPTYNRAQAINRVFNSLKKQTYKNFEWVIIDDGSIDNTRQVVEKYIEDGKLNIQYISHENRGKHYAINEAVSMAKGKFFLIADSDDEFVPESLEIFVKEWEKIPDNEKNYYKGITCRCVDVNGKLVGNKTIPEPYVDMRETEFKYKYRYTGELWGIIRTDVMKEFPFPTPKGLKFYPESVIWDKMAEKYITRYINKSLRIIYSDQENATTVANKNNRFKENYILWNHYLNDLWNFRKYDRVSFLKAIIGINRDGVLAGKSRNEILLGIKRKSIKKWVSITYGVGYLMAKLDL
ncbi:glycosyltransferase family A protein [Streptococcus equinus]|uniref:glycosyltransferase family A protein n=1 Tax=Streptococcus equinus TaxID=1335 RepID=UPI003BF80902